MTKDSGWRLIWGSLVLALIPVIIVALLNRKRLGRKLAEVAWSFTDSWASTITEIGALLGVLVAAELIPEDATPFSSGALAGLSLLFGSLAVISPLVFSAISVEGEDDPEEPGPRYQGFVVVFLVSSLITLWAVLGQLGTLLVLVHEAQTASALATGVSTLFLWLGLASALLVIAYGLRTMGTVINFRAASPPSRDAEGQMVAGQSARQWTLL